MLWLKSFHIIFVVTWFAGLFYLPRLFIYHLQTDAAAERDRFRIMERRLLGITHIGGALAITFGVALMAWWQLHNPAYLFTGWWFRTKLLLVLVLVAYHALLVWLTGCARRDAIPWSERSLRIFNEIPGLLLIAIVILVVVKPF